MVYPAQYTQSEVLSVLLKKADVEGFITSKDIVEHFPWGQDDDDLFDELILKLRQKGVKIEDDEDGEVEADTLDLYESPPTDLGPAVNLDYLSADDTVGLYLKEMSRVPLLSLAEEVRLAQRIEQGRLSKRALAKMNGHGTPTKRHELDTQVQDGVQAREHLIKANTRLVVSIAKKYIGQNLPFLDLIQEGNLGLMKAVEKYEYKRGFRFSTYATWWIRQTMFT
jgi:RNA polymerase primary sigma factor